MLQHEAGGPSGQGYRPEADDPSEVREAATWYPLINNKLITNQLIISTLPVAWRCGRDSMPALPACPTRLPVAPHPAAAPLMTRTRLMVAAFPAHPACLAQAGALSAPLWELTLLTQHYHPTIAAVSGQLAANSTVAQLPLTGNAGVFAASYSTAAGAFNPPPTAGRRSK